MQTNEQSKSFRSHRPVGLAALALTASWLLLGIGCLGTPKATAATALLVNQFPTPESANSIRDRLQRIFGFQVILVSDDSSVPAIARQAALIVITANVASFKMTQYRNVAAPILIWEWAAYDGLALSLDNGEFSSYTETQIEIVNPAHPLAAGFPAGPLTVFDAPASEVAFVDPALLAPSVTVIATAADGTGRAAIFGVEAGAELHPDPTSGAPIIAPARRTGFFLGGQSFLELNDDGLKLFDAAVNWTAKPHFHRPTFDVGKVTLSWVGTGTLEQTESLSPLAWTVAPSQANPQTVPATGTRFYRIRQ